MPTCLMIYSLTTKIKNTKDVVGGEMRTCIWAFGRRQGPEKQLRGFQKVFMKPGKRQTVKFTLHRRDLSVCDADT